MDEITQETPRKPIGITRAYLAVKRSGLTQDYIAAKLTMERSRVSRCLTGKANFTPPQKKGLAVLLGMDEDALWMPFYPDRSSMVRGELRRFWDSEEGELAASLWEGWIQEIAANIAEKIVAEKLAERGKTVP